MNELFLRLIENSKNWSSFKTELDKNAQKVGKLFEIFCKYYFLAEPSIKDDYKNVWLTDEIPLEVKSKLNIEGVEHGVDLVLEDKDGKFSAVQCKFRVDEDKNLSWTKDKIANLFGFTNKADKFIVFTNASELDEVSKTRVEDFTFYNISNLLSINEGTFNNIALKAKGEEVIQVKLKPRDYQQEAIDKVSEYFKSNDRGQMILPCGAGKTLTALWIKENLQSLNTLVLVPSLALLRQTKEVWLAQKNEPFKYLCVCSEEDIDKSSDAPVTHVYEIGGRVATSSQEISDFLKLKTNKVIFSTYQSLDVIEKAIKDKNTSFDLIISDEAHKTAGSVKGSNFTLVHDNEKIPSNKRLYMTATPRVTSASLKEKLGEDYEYVADMSNPNIFGSEAYRMSFKEAIDRNILVDYKIIAVGVTDEELAEYINKRMYVKDKPTIDQYANNYALKTIMDKYTARHALTFHSRLSYAEEFSERNKNLYKDTLTEFISGKQATSYRAKLLNAFKKSPKGVIANAKCLTEGIDVPAIDLVYFCDPKYSKIDIVQASGRALRRNDSANKKIGYIVVPVFHTKRESVENAIDKSVFKNLIQVIRALCDQDERLQDEINKISFQKGMRKKLSKLDFVYKKQPEAIIKLENFEEKLKESIFSQVIEKTKDNWFVQYEYLKQFRKIQPNRWPIPKKDEFPKGNKLGDWCSWQRQELKKSRLNESKITLLNSIGFQWDKWDYQYFLLKEYVLEKNEWPNSETVFRGNNLGNWCITQKVLYKKNKLIKVRFTLLNQICFPWIQEDGWLKQFTYLKKYRKFYPTRWPTKKEEFPKGNNIGSWISVQRSKFAQKKLSEDRIMLLNQISFPWDGEGHRLESIWLMHFSELKQFKNKHPLRWPTHYEEFPRGNKLGLWLYFQKQSYDNKMLSNENVNLLKSINFPLNTKKNIHAFWWKQYQYLLDYRSKYPQRWPRPREEFPKGNKLANWCLVQREAYNNKKLSQEKIELLENIGFQWIKKWHRD